MARTKLRIGRTEFHENTRGIGELLKSPQVLADLVRRAEDGRAYAETIAPHDTGHYAASFYVRSTRQGGIRNDRAIAWLGNRDLAALAIEYGSKDTPAHATLRHAAYQAMGD